MKKSLTISAFCAFIIASCAFAGGGAAPVVGDLITDDKYEVEELKLTTVAEVRDEEKSTSLEEKWDIEDTLDGKVITKTKKVSLTNKDILEFVAGAAKIYYVDVEIPVSEFEELEYGTIAFTDKDGKILVVSGEAGVDGFYASIVESAEVEVETEKYSKNLKKGTYKISENERLTQNVLVNLTFQSTTDGVVTERNINFLARMISKYRENEQGLVAESGDYLISGDTNSDYETRVSWSSNSKSVALIGEWTLEVDDVTTESGVLTKGVLSGKSKGSDKIDKAQVELLEVLLAAEVALDAAQVAFDAAEEIYLAIIAPTPAQQAAYDEAGVDLTDAENAYDAALAAAFPPPPAPAPAS